MSQTRLKRITPVLEHEWGLYVWEGPKGIVADDEHNFLSIPAKFGDETKIKALEKFVREELGLTEGSAKFIPGARQISQSEYEDQMERMLDGKEPDPIAELDRANRGKGPV